MGINPNAMRFNESVENNGLIIDQTEGDIFIIFSTQFMLDSLLPILNNNSRKLVTDAERMCLW